MSKPRSLKKDAEIAVIPGNPLVLRGARNVRTLSAAFIADLQEDWEKYGTQILELMREKFPDLYFASIVKLAQIVRIEADVSLKEPWDFLREIAYERQLSLSELINAISQAKSRKVTLASALRVFVAQHYRAAASQRC